MFEIMLGNPGPPEADAEPGQVMWSTPGTYTWVVPTGVRKVCCSMVNAGQSGTVQNVNYNGITERGYGGMGGFYKYKNDITVTPGQIITIVVASGGTNASGTAAKTGNGGTPSTKVTAFAMDAAGSSGSMSYGLDNAWKYGNGAGTPASPNGVQNGNGAGVNIIDGTTVARVGNNGQNAGGGGSGYVSGSTWQKTKGGDGAVRIMWGAGRSYPATNSQDV